MKKGKIITAITGITGAMIFGTGVCMALIIEWDLMTGGLLVSAAGAYILIMCTILHSGLSRNSEKL